MYAQVEATGTWWTIKLQYAGVQKASEYSRSKIRVIDVQKHALHIRHAHRQPAVINT